MSKLKPPVIYICDIDGTIADAAHRLKAAGPRPEDVSGQAFQEWLEQLQQVSMMMKDAPLPNMRELIDLLVHDSFLFYVTGREEKYRAVTERWLEFCDFPIAPISMRPNGDLRSARDYKEEVLLEICKSTGCDKLVIFDDDDYNNCSSMYTERGWLHLKPMNCLNKLESS